MWRSLIVVYSPLIPIGLLLCAIKFRLTCKPIDTVRHLIYSSDKKVQRKQTGRLRVGRPDL